MTAHRTTQAAIKATDTARSASPPLSTTPDLFPAERDSGQPSRKATVEDEDEGFTKIEKDESGMEAGHAEDHTTLTPHREDELRQDTIRNSKPDSNESLVKLDDRTTETQNPDPSRMSRPEDRAVHNKRDQSTEGWWAKSIKRAGDRLDDLLRKPEVFIAVMGKTGTGKTSFINAVTGNNLEVGHSLQACTQEIQVANTKINERSVTFIDTPGFDDTNRSDVDILGEITAWLQNADSQNVRLSGIIYLHKITDNRMEGSTRKNIKMFRSLCGDENFGNVILCTTGWSLVDAETGEKRMEELAQTEGFWADMKQKGAQVRCHRGLDLSASAITIAKELVQKETFSLQIQKELVDRSLRDTSAGRLILEEMEKMKVEHQQEIRDIRKELEAAKNSNNEEEVADLKKYYEKEIEGLKKAQEELEKLRNADRDHMIKVIEKLQADLDKKGGKCVIC